MFLGRPEASTTVAQTTEMYLLTVLEAEVQDQGVRRFGFPCRPPPCVTDGHLIGVSLFGLSPVSLRVSAFPLLVLQTKRMDTRWERGVDERKEGLMWTLIFARSLSCI